jgi:hypothetical protein
MNKYSAQQTGEYSRQLAKMLSDKFFQNKSTINGQELMTFSPVRQINLLIVKELLGNWHREMASLKSPYFDYEAEPVKTSLAEFMNVLSQHILISRNNFEPLAEKAIYYTIQLATDTLAFFESTFLQTDREIDLDKLRSYLRYLDHGRELFTGFIDDLHLGNINRDFVLQRFKLHLNAHYKDQADSAKLLTELNQLLQLPKEEPEQKTPQPAPVREIQPAEPVKPAPETVPPAPEPKPVNPVAPVASAPAVVTPPTPAPRPVAPIATEQKNVVPQPATEMPKAPVQEPAVSSGGLNDRYKTEHTSLNDKLRKPAAATLADAMGERKIESLKNSISINQRFAFINELFGGDNQAYHAAITELDQQPDLDSARDFVLTDLQKAYDWNVQGEHVAKLLRLVDRKFA